LIVGMAIDSHFRKHSVIFYNFNLTLTNKKMTVYPTIDCIVLSLD
jgi:hypothetical protein